MREGGLERVEAIIERQERVPPKGNDDSLFLKREHRRLGLLGSGGPVGNRATLLPLGDGFWIGPVALGQHPQPAPSGSLDYAGSLDALPPSCGRSHGELGP